jgi:hypothetical protein
MPDQVKDLQDLEDRVAKVLLGTNQLPPGPERQELLDDIKRFIARLSKLKWQMTRHPVRRDARWTPEEDDLLREMARTGESVAVMTNAWGFGPAHSGMNVWWSFGHAPKTCEI